MKNLVYSFVWFFFSSAVILAGVTSAYYMTVAKPDLLEPSYDQTVQITTPQIAGAATLQEPAVAAVAEVGDARVVLVDNFLVRHGSPLAEEDDFAQVLVDLADKYEVDFRLLPSIAMQESNLCKVVPEGSYNCLGLGVHERGTWGFTSYEENFEAAAKILKKNYIDIGLTTPEQIMQKYTPKSNGSWAESVNQWMAEMRYDDRQLGRELKTDADLLEFTENQ